MCFIMRKLILFIICVLVGIHGYADMARFSTAGFYELPNTGREAYSLNQAWRFWKGEADGTPYAVDYDDTDWEVVSVPHGLEYLPVEASGCANYQGVAWYRKHFTPADSLKGKQLFVHFEGIMGKSEVYVNGSLVKKHYGGYLPVIVDVSTLLKFGEENVIAVKADNSDDPTYPVGKEQSMLDFTYFGGIYRDCWLVAHNDVFITNANYENEVAGGGLFVSYDKVSEAQATVNLKAHVRNASGKNCRVTVCFALKNPEGKMVKEAEKKLSLKNGKAAHTTASMVVEAPSLWSPESPYLYHLDILVKDASGRVIDGYRQRIGIRSIEFKKTEGLWLNGKPYKGKIMGTNRHQDFAVLGNALPNSLQWRDAKKLRDAGLKVIRTHYVIDPAFMDACDELGLFALVEVPGWQFWNKEPIFAERIYSDIRNMIRIHRNHASLFFWEPILNETHYPETFAKRALEICGITTCCCVPSSPSFAVTRLILSVSGATTWTTGMPRTPTAVWPAGGVKFRCCFRPNIMRIRPIRKTSPFYVTRLSVRNRLRLWEPVSGIRSTISADTMPIPSTGVSWMPSASPKRPITCSCRSVNR